jgi:aspartate/methionine/tyrosine aminotransferase
MRERTVVIQSFSKSFAMTGWRIGYAFGPQWIMESMVKVVASFTSCAPSISQRAALAALTLGRGIAEDMITEFQERRDLAYGILCSIPGVRVHKPAGSFYIFPDISQITLDGLSFAMDLLKAEQVVVVPGETFGPSGSGCVRLALTVNQERLMDAIERIGRFISATY